MNKKTIFFLEFIFILFILLLIIFPTNTLAVYPKLISKIITGFEVIKGWIVKIATPAAAVAVRNRNFYEKI